MNETSKNDDNFRILFEQAPLGYQSLDIDGNFIEINQKWLDTFGYEREEIIGKWFGDFLTPEYKEAFAKNFPMFKAQGHIHVEFEMLHKNGDILFIAFEGQIGNDAEGHFKQTHCILEDITEKKKIESELKESEEKFRNFFETSNVGKSMTSISGEIHVNKAFCDMLGYAEEELKKKKWQEITPSEDIEHSQKKIDPLIKGEKPSIRFVKRYLHKNGSVVWADVSSSIHKDLQNRPSYFITTVIDITEQKLAEHKLKELLTRHKTFIDTVPDIIMEVDRNKVYTWANKAGYEFFGDDVIGKEVSYYFEGDQDIYDKVEPLFKGDEEIIYLESYQKRKDGEVRLLAWWCKVYKDSDGNTIGAVSSARDITDIKQAEKKIRFLAQITENSPIITAYYDKDLNMVWANKSYLTATGLGIDEIKIRKCFDVWKLSKPCKGCPVIKAINTGDVSSYELTPDNQDHWPETQGYWLSQAVPVRDDHGEIIGAIEFAVDITARKQAEIELNKKVAELEETNSVMVGRELRMIELKEEINRLLKEAGKPEKY